MVFHKPILHVLNSKTKQKIVLFLLKHEALMSEREIAAVSGVSHMSVNRVMHELAQMNFVHILRTGRSHLWRINRDSYAYQVLSEILQLPAGSRAPFQDVPPTVPQSANPWRSANAATASRTASVTRQSFSRYSPNFA